MLCHWIETTSVAAVSNGGVLLYFGNMLFTESIRSFNCRIPVFSACLLIACMLGESSVVLAGDGARTHVLLINGGGNRRINYQSHLLHVKRIYRILNEAGVPANQISILSSDGSDPAADLATRETQSETKFWMLAGTRLNKALRPPITYANSEVQGAQLQAATRDNLREWFETAAATLGAGDSLLIYVTDHGTQNKDDL